jgi:hypothetical protein
LAEEIELTQHMGNDRFKGRVRAVQLLGDPLALVITNRPDTAERLGHPFKGGEGLLYQVGDERANKLAAVLGDDAKNLMLAG